MKTSIHGFGRLATVLLWLAGAEYASAFYEPTVQRWINRDPMGERGFDLRRQHHGQAEHDELNTYLFVQNAAPNEVDYLGLFLGWGYGNWCGYSRSGPSDPIDEIDAACKTHDYCLATVGDFLIPGKRFCCNAAFCRRVVVADCSTSPNPTACEDARIDIMALCGMVLTVGVLIGL